MSNVATYWWYQHAGSESVTQVCHGRLLSLTVITKSQRVQEPGAIVIPPSATRVCPVTNADAGAARNTAAHAVQFFDTWHVHGMRGTGSQDFAVNDLFVSDSQSFDMATLAPQQPGALFASMPYMAMMMVPHAPVATGIALACIDAFCDLATRKTPLMSKSLLAQKALAQDALGHAVAEVEAGRAYLKAAIAGAGTSFDLAAGTALHLAATHATHSSVAAVDRLYAAAGGSAVFESSAIQRHFRDIHVAASHFLVNPEKYAAAGRVTLGLAPSMLH